MGFANGLEISMNVVWLPFAIFVCGFKARDV